MNPSKVRRITHDFELMVYGVVLGIAGQAIYQGLQLYAPFQYVWQYFFFGVLLMLAIAALYFKRAREW